MGSKVYHKRADAFSCAAARCAATCHPRIQKALSVPYEAARQSIPSPFKMGWRQAGFYEL